MVRCTWPGRLGATLLTALLERQWVQRHPGDRVLTVTDTGGPRFAELGIACDAEPRRRAVTRHQLRGAAACRDRLT
ncbi:hypothetical protein [Amycolatopsis sp. NPDC004378]